jgi:hypothetical protein
VQNVVGTLKRILFPAYKLRRLTRKHFVSIIISTDIEAADVCDVPFGGLASSDQDVRSNGGTFREAKLSQAGKLLPASEGQFPTIQGVPRVKVTTSGECSLC